MWYIGKTVVPGVYEKHQADEACFSYLDRYERRHAQVKILGMAEPVPLASIYTEARIVSPTFLHGYRTQEELQELFLRKGRSLAGYDCDEPRPALDIANNEEYQFLNLLGTPGAGKSTFLRYIGWMAVQRYRLSTTAQGESHPATLPYRFNLLPVLLELRSLRNAPLDFVALIDHELRTNGLPAGFGCAALQAGGLLVLLDGLDEVPADKLDDTIQGIRDLVDQHPGCRYITSCRTAFYKNYFNRFTDVLLTDFTDDQIQNLIENWFRSDRDRDLGTAAALWKLLKDPYHQATRELARTPLLATFLCLVYDDRQQLPTNRAELYGDALRILLERWAASKRVRAHREPVFPGLSTKRELLMLEAIAGPAYEREQYFFTAQELATAIEKFLQSDVYRPDTVDGRQVVEEIEGKQGLLVQRAHDKYSFSHLTLHEYLAACHYYKSGRSKEVVKKTLANERWREVHLLLAGLQEPDADAFLLAITIETAEQVTSEPLKRLLSWAGRIVRLHRTPERTAARRALMMGFAFALTALDLDLARDRDLDLARDPVCDLVRDLVWALVRDLDLALNLALDLDPALEPDLARARARAHARASVRPLTHRLDPDFALDPDSALLRAFHHVYTLSPMIIQHGMITPERNAGFVEASAHAVLQGIQNALDFPPLESPLSPEDEGQCVEFLTRTQHIFEYCEAAERVTQVGWDQVCERLITLPRSE